MQAPPQGQPVAVLDCGALLLLFFSDKSAVLALLAAPILIVSLLAMNIDRNKTAAVEPGRALPQAIVAEPVPEDQALLRLAESMNYPPVEVRRTTLAYLKKARQFHEDQLKHSSISAVRTMTLQGAYPFSVDMLQRNTHIHFFRQYDRYKQTEKFITQTKDGDRVRRHELICDGDRLLRFQALKKSGNQQETLYYVTISKPDKLEIDNLNRELFSSVMSILPTEDIFVFDDLSVTPVVVGIDKNKYFEISVDLPEGGRIKARFYGDNGMLDCAEHYISNDRIRQDKKIIEWNHLNGFSFPKKIIERTFCTEGEQLGEVEIIQTLDIREIQLRPQVPSDDFFSTDLRQFPAQTRVMDGFTDMAYTIGD